VGLADDLAEALDLLDDLEAPHMVVGAIALEALGVPRSTLDIDLQVQLPDPPARHTSYFHGWFIAERSTDEVFGQDVLILEGKATGVPVEMFLTSHRMTEQALERRTRVRSGLLNREIPVPTPEDFILLKAAYHDDPGRAEAKATQDRLDIEGVVEAHGAELDRAYLEDNARDLGAWETLEPWLPK
jgi:hypothetical protein